MGNVVKSKVWGNLGYPFQLGTYTIALCAKELNKPVYVLCESYKFVRLYPLNQQDMPNEFKVIT